MDIYDAAVTLCGVISLLVLLGMFVAEFVYPGLRISERAYATLLLLISVFLGVDLVQERKDRLLAILRGALKGAAKAMNNDDSDDSRD